VADRFTEAAGLHGDMPPVIHDPARGRVAHAEVNVDIIVCDEACPLGLSGRYEGLPGTWGGMSGPPRSR